jgi:type II secretory pathway component PulF
MGSAAYAVIVHSVMPLMLLVLSVYVMPRLQVSFQETSDGLPASLKRVAIVTNFIGRYWHIYLLLFGAGVAADAMICYRLFRSGRTIAARLWTTLITAVELCFVGWCVYGMISTIYNFEDSSIFTGAGL